MLSSISLVQTGEKAEEPEGLEERGGGIALQEKGGGSDGRLKRHLVGVRKMEGKPESTLAIQIKC